MEAAVQDAAAQAAAESAALDTVVRDLATELNKPPFSFDPGTTRKGTIISVSPYAIPPTISVQLSGDTSTTIDSVRFTGTFTPVVGDVVLLEKQGTDIWASGKIATFDITPADGGQWLAPTLSAGFTTAGNSQGALFYARVWRDGGWKITWKGAVARSSGTTVVAAGVMGADWRPGSKKTLFAPSSDGGCMVDFAINGTISLGLVTTTTSSVDPVDNTTSVDPADVTSSDDAGYSNSSDAGYSGVNDAGYSDVRLSGYLSAGGSDLGHQHYTGGHQHYTGSHQHYTGSHNHGVLGSHSHGVTGSHSHSATANPTWVSFDGLEYWA